MSASGRPSPNRDQTSSAGRTGSAASNWARAKASFASIRSPVSTKVTSLRCPPSALRQTFTSGGGALAADAGDPHAVGAVVVEPIVSNRATTSGPA